MATQERRGWKQLWRALGWSWQGLRAAWRHEASFRLEAGIFPVFFLAGLWLGADPIEKVLLAGTPVLVLVIELLNSAIEAVVDLVSPDYHPLAGRAKDMGSAAALLAMLLVACTWCLILGGHYLG